MERVDVLVVGAGPTGLIAASELLRHGCSVRLIEKLVEPSPWSRAPRWKATPIL
jgi:2-polyprenyl-6-methoxyphenol hydroxylase-like FAD-dependent oxidoreductase